MIVERHIVGKQIVKLWVDARKDPKLTRIDPSWRACWFELMMLAGELDYANNDSGRIEVAPGDPLTNEEIAHELSVSLDVWTAACHYFERVNMLRWDGNTLILTKFQCRQQGDDPTAVMRNREYRERQRTRRQYLESALDDLREAPSERNVTRNERNVTNEAKMPDERNLDSNSTPDENRNVTRNRSRVTLRKPRINTSTSLSGNGSTPRSEPIPDKPQAFELFLQARAGAVNAMDIERVTDLVADYGDDAVCEAIRVCNMNKSQGFFSLRYLVRTLQGYQRDGKFQNPNEEKKPYASVVIQ